MKKTIIPILAVALILAFSLPALGASIKVGIPVGSAYFEEGFTDMAATGYSLSYDGAIGDSIVYGLSYDAGTYGSSSEYYYIEGRLGYRILTGGALTLDAFAAYNYGYFYGGDIGQCLLIGADLGYAFSDSLSAYATAKTSVLSTHNYVDNFTLTSINLGLSYAFGDQLAAQAGYDYIIHTGDGYNDFGIKGFAVGLTYSF